MKSCVSSLAVALSSVVGAALQTPGAKPTCSSCNDRGVFACRACVKSGCRGSRDVDVCSEAKKCKTCAGARFEECGKCERPLAADLPKRRTELATWREALRPIDERLGHELRHCESPHFVLTFDIQRVDTPGAGGAHAAMHVYLDRLESFFADFCQDLSCTDKDFLAKTHVMLWGKEVDQEKASVEYTRQQSNTESKLMGAKPVVSIFYDKNHMHEEYELHQAVVHQVAHCLLSNVFDGVWPGNIRGGWIDEGSAHFYENKYFGEVRHYCYVESDSIQYFKFGRWESAVRAAVDKNESLGFLGVTGINTVEMTPEQRMFAWSFCDYILRATPGKFGALAKAIKAKQPVAQALSGTLGVSPFEFEAQWRQWVVASYSLKKK